MDKRACQSQTRKQKSVIFSPETFLRRHAPARLAVADSENENDGETSANDSDWAPGARATTDDDDGGDDDDGSSCSGSDDDDGDGKSGGEPIKGRRATARTRARRSHGVEEEEDDDDDDDATDRGDDERDDEEEDLAWCRATHAALERAAARTPPQRTAAEAAYVRNYREAPLSSESHGSEYDPEDDDDDDDDGDDEDEDDDDDEE